MDLFDIRGGNICLANAALTGLSGTAKTISYTGNPAFAIGGSLYTGDTCSGGALETTDDTTGDPFVSMVNGEMCLFVFTLNSDGTWHVSQGPVVDSADVTNGAAALEFPRIPDDAVPFAYVSIKNAHATTTWTFGTDNWDDATLTIGTVINCMLLPTQPLTAATA